MPFSSTYARAHRSTSMLATARIRRTGRIVLVRDAVMITCRDTSFNPMP
jgi:hypothetical protein